MLHAPKQLDTPRLLLRQWQNDDIEGYAPLCADPEVMRYLGGNTMSREDSWRHMAVLAGHWQLKGFGQWAVEEKASGDFVGRVGFLEPDGWPGFELGWTIASGFQRQGLAREAAQACLDWAFRQAEVPEVISIIHPDNLASRQLALTLGERYWRDDQVRGMAVNIYGVSRDKYLAR